MLPGVGSAAGPPPLISISVVSHGDWAPLSALLESLAAFESAQRIQLIVTDNLGSDLSGIAPARWHSVQLLRPRQPRGYAANHNAAFEHATGDHFCILNPDVLFTQPILDDLIRRLEEGRAGMAAPVLANSRGQLQDSFRALPTPWAIVGRWLGRLDVVPPPERGSLLHPDWIAGMFMLMRSSTFSLLGGFDDRYRLYFEDVDLCTRLRLSGMTIVVDPSLRLLHDPRRRSRRPGRHLLWHVQSAVRFFSSPTYRRARELKQDA